MTPSFAHRIAPPMLAMALVSACKDEAQGGIALSKIAPAERKF